MTLDDLTERIRVHNKERDWHHFHPFINLTMAMGLEVAEITEHL